MDKFRERSRRSNTWQLVEIYTTPSTGQPLSFSLTSSPLSISVSDPLRSNVNLPIYRIRSSSSLSGISSSFFTSTLPSLAYVFLYSGKENVDRAVTLYLHREKERCPSPLSHFCILRSRSTDPFKDIEKRRREGGGLLLQPEIPAALIAILVALRNRVVRSWRVNCVTNG